MKLKYIQILVMFLYLPLCGYGQDNAIHAPKDDLQASASFQRLHLQQISQGRQYYYIYPAIEGHQYWDHPIYKIGVLTFEGNTYQNILLNYDNYNNLLLTVIVQNGLTKNIILDNSRIESFRINDQDFVNVRDSTNILYPGIYNMAFDAPEVQLFVKTQKSVAPISGRPGDFLKKFVQKETNILMIEGKMHVVKNKKDVLEAFSKLPSLMAYVNSSQQGFKKLRFKKEEMTASLLAVLGAL